MLFVRISQILCWKNQNYVGKSKALSLYKHIIGEQRTPFEARQIHWKILIGQ
jgi:hypothetical protein